MSDGITFVVPSGQISDDDRMQHIAIQATAVILKGWFEEEEPTPDQAQRMVEAVMKGLLAPRRPPA